LPLIETRALVLHAFPYGDTSRILRLLTPRYGLRSVIAKGAQRPKSRFGGVLEPFTEGDAQFNLREGRDLFTLSGFTLVRSRQGIGRNLAAFSGASLLAEIALRTGTEEAQPELYDSLVHTFDSLAQGEAPAAPTALAAVWRALSILGFQPEMEACVRCGRELGADEPARFDVEAGGSACRLCRPAGRLLDSVTRNEVALMSSSAGEALPLHDPALHARMVEAFLATHVAGDRPLRALGLFLDNLRNDVRADS
jgi:DNA repair protein RecO (recombination protein O)